MTDPRPSSLTGVRPSHGSALDARDSGLTWMGRSPRRGPARPDGSVDSPMDCTLALPGIVCYLGPHLLLV